MSIKGMSEEVVSALEFDPFKAGGGSDGGTETKAPRAREIPSGTTVPLSMDKQTEWTNRAPGRDPVSGKFTPAGQPAQQGTRAVPAAPTVGRDVSPDGIAPQMREAQRVPTGGGMRPDEEPLPENSVEELMTRVKEAGPMIAPPGGMPQQSAPGQQPNFPQYDYGRPWPEQRVNLPPELLEAIFHEDRDIAAQGMGVLVNTLYNSLASEVHTRIAAILHQVPQYLDNYSTNVIGQQQLRDKFYTQFPHLATNQGMSTVYTIAQNVAALYQNMGQQIDPMSDDFIRYVGKEAERVLGLQKPMPRRQFQTGGGTRDGGGTGGNPFMEAIGLA